MANEKGKEKGMDARGKAEMARMAALGTEEAAPSPMDAGSFGYGDAGAAADTAAMADMGPRGSHAKVSPDTGELYYPEGAPAPARAATRATAKAPAARSTARPSAGMGNSAGGRGPGFGELAAYEQQKAQAAAASKPKPRTLSMSDKLNPEGTDTDTEGGLLGRRVRAALGSKYKKGGVVKKMASGSWGRYARLPAATPRLIVPKVAVAPLSSRTPAMASRSVVFPEPVAPVRRILAPEETRQLTGVAIRPGTMNSSKFTG
jgi:hypothetical protein